VGALPHWCAPGGGRDRIGVACSGSAMRTVRPAAEVNGGDGAPVVGGGEEELGELQGDVGKLGVGPIGVGEGRRGVLHGEQEATVGGARRQWCSGWNSLALRGW
jgi:hypothetical protein